MTDLLIYNARIITPQKILARGWLIAHQGRISAIGNGDPAHKSGYHALDMTGMTVLPGFVDVHTHGAMGYDVMDARPDSLIGMSQFFARHGVTSFLATTWTHSQEHITQALETIKATRNHPDLHANLLGAHLEGPYLNALYGGPQPLGYIRRAVSDEARYWLGLGVIRLITLAPEYDENAWLMREAVAHGITVSVGYSNATYAQTQAAIALGLTHCTHVYNDMRPFHHQEPGVLGAVLEAGQVGCEVIADGVHVHDGALCLLWQLKRPDKLMLISANIRVTGLGDGEFVVNGLPLRVQDGVAWSVGGELAGGSVLPMDGALRHFIRAVDAPIDAVWQIASLNPARAVHVAHRKGSIEIGKDADLVILDSTLQVQRTIIGGRIVYENSV